MADEEPRRGTSKEREDASGQPSVHAPNNLTAHILDSERSMLPFALVVGGALLMLCAVPLAAYAGMQRNIWAGALAVVLLAVGYLMRRKGKLG